MADAVYYHGNEAAQAIIDKANLKATYTVLESRIFKGHLFKHLIHQEWNVILVEQRHESIDGPNYIVSFEGTDAPGDWVADAIDKFLIPHPLLKDMATQVTAWMSEHSIHKMHALTGHSAGAMFVKYSFDTSGQDYERIGAPYLITLNGFDPRPQKGPRQIDIRVTGDAVSACLGAREPISVCSTQPHMGIVGSHHLASFDLEDVTWSLLDQSNRHGFVHYPRSMRQTDAFKRCNAGILDPTTDKSHLNKVGSDTTAATVSGRTYSHAGLLQSIFGDGDTPEDYDHGKAKALENMGDVTV